MENNDCYEPRNKKSREDKQFRENLLNVCGNFAKTSLDCIEKQNNELEQLQQENQKLRNQLEEKDKVIDEINKRCNQEISAATIQYKRQKRNDTWQYIISHKRILEILESGKNV